MKLEDIPGIEQKIKTASDTSFLFKGCMDYSKDDIHYSEENFRVYQIQKEFSTVFFSEQSTPLASGEFLKSSTFFQMNKDWIPTKVIIDQHMGKQHLFERFTTIKSENHINYEYYNDGEEKTFQLTLPPRFHIATGHMCTSVLFLKGRNVESGGKHYQNIYLSENNWKLVGPPPMKFVLMRKPNNNKTSIDLQGSRIKSMFYEIFGDENYEKTKEIPMKVYLSSHFGIPYKIELPGNLEIKIRFLNEMEKLNISI